MIKIFLYGNLAKINFNDEKCETCDSYIIIKKYDIENNILEIDNKNNENNMLLHGKIAIFNMKIDDLIEKINNITEYKYYLSKDNINFIYANKMSGGVCKTYILY